MTDKQKEFRRGDTVEWPGHVDYPMYVVVVDYESALVTTDAWAQIPAHELVLARAVEDKYDSLFDAISRAVKERP